MTHFIRHYVEMLIAMFAGMLVLGGPAALALDAAGVGLGAEAELLGMAATMTIPMVAWMRYRGHGWAPAWEMSAAMFVPTFAALGMLWSGATTDAHAAMMVQHIGMFPAMLAAMLLRRGEYSHRHARIAAA